MTPTANCPDCNAQLQRTHHEGFDSWVCPAGHGLAATMSETYNKAQEDELERLWDLARAGRDGAASRPCPMCSRPMLAVELPVDHDEAEEGHADDTADHHEVPVDICEPDQVIWFDTGELEQMPADLEDAKPSPEAEAALARIRAEFGAGVEAAQESREGFTDAVADRLLRSAVFGRLARRMAS